MKKLLTVLFASLMVFCLAGCSGSNDAATDAADATVEATNPLDDALLADGKIIIGTSPDYPPFETLSAAGELEGFEIDLMKEVVDILNEQNGTNYEIEFKQMDFSTIIGALQASQIDIGLSGFTYSPERDCIFTTPHFGTKQVIVTREDTGITCADDLIGKKVAAGEGTTGDMALIEIVDEGNVTYPGDYTVMYQALQAGQLDAVVSDEAVGDNYVAEMGLVKCAEALVDEEMSFIIKTGNTVLADAVNKAVETFMATDGYNALVAKWELQ